MKVSKKMLDEAIKDIRDFWDITNLKNKDLILNSSHKKCEELSKSVRDISHYTFLDIISAYVRCNATNETIYKAIELLGIEIEGVEK